MFACRNSVVAPSRVPFLQCSDGRGIPQPSRTCSGPNDLQKLNQHEMQREVAAVALPLTRGSAPVGLWGSFCE
jgi:hypothetical protein